MNKLIERLRVISRRYDKEDGIEDAIKALEAADRMADVLRQIEEIRRKLDRVITPFNAVSNEALTAYRNLTQETPHA